jgi:hypothetical protein
MFAVTQVALLVAIELCVVVGLAMAAVRWQQHQRQLRTDIDRHRDGVDENEAMLDTRTFADDIVIARDDESAETTFLERNV